MLRLSGGHARRLVRQVLAGLAAFALAGISVVSACHCMTKATWAAEASCCCSTESGFSVRMQAGACGDGCGIAPARAPLGEVLAPSSRVLLTAAVVVPVPDRALRAPAAAPIGAAHLASSRSHPILRI
jgi:hypothetical protein